MELTNRPYIATVNTPESKHFYFSIRYRDFVYSGYLFHRGDELRYSAFNQWEEIISRFKYNIRTTEFVYRINEK